MSKRDRDTESTAIDRPTRLPRRTAAVSDELEDADDETPLAELADERFAVTEEIARGGMGRVLAARDRRLDRTVAIKEALGSSARTRARFEREVQITAKLQHPAILPLYDARVWTSGEPYYVMRLVSGEPLSARIAGAASLGERLSLLPSLQAAADALAFAHDAGVVHRDVKPSNILVGEHGETIVIDWGIAKDIGAAPDQPDGDDDGAPSTASHPSGILGTPGYMAPEQAAGDDASFRSDIYSLGASLYHLLAGKRPFDGLDSDAIRVAQLAGPPTPLGEIVRGVPAELLAIVDRALASDPADRYPNATELAEDLRRFQTGRLVGAYEYTLFERLARFARRHRVSLAVLAVAAAVVVAVVTSSVRRIRAERDNALAASVREAARADELLLVRARRLLERGEPTKAAAILKKLPLFSTETTSAQRVLAEARRRGVRDELPGPKSWAALRWHPRQPLLVVAGDKTVRVHDLSGPSPSSRTLVELSTYLVSVAFIDGGSRLVVAPRSAALIFIDVDGDNRDEIAISAAAVAMEVASDDAVIWRDVNGAVWRRESKGSPVRLGDAGRGDTLEISADGRVIATGTVGDGPAVVWIDGERFELPAARAIDLDDAGARALALGDEAVVAYQLGDEGPVETRRWPLRLGAYVARGRDGRTLVTASVSRVYQLADDGSSRQLADLSASFETSIGLVTLEASGALVLDDVAGERLELPKDRRRAIHVAAGHELVAVGDSSGRVSIYHLADITGHSLRARPAASVAFSKDHLLVLGSQTIERYDETTRALEQVARLEYDSTRAMISRQSGYLLNVNGPLSELVDLANGTIEPMPLTSEIVAFDEGGALLNTDGSKLLRTTPGSGLPLRVVFDAGAAITHFFARPGTIIVATENGDIIGDAGSPTEWKVNVGGAVRSMAVADDGSVIVARERVISRVSPGKVATLRELPSAPIYVSARGTSVVAVSLEHAMRIDERGQLVALDISGLRLLRLLADPDQLVVLAGSGEVLLVDFERRQARPLAARLPAIRSIETDGDERVAIVRVNGRVDLLRVEADKGPARLRFEIEAATRATLDDATDELVWP